jgi:hypothetical protein
VTQQGIEFAFPPGPHPPGQTLLLEGPDTAGLAPRQRAHRRESPGLGRRAGPGVASRRPAGRHVAFSDWAQQDLPRKTVWMAALLAEAAGDAGTAGVVVSCGQQVGPGAVIEDCRGRDGIIGMRRRFDALRMRETIIVPLAPDGAGLASLWRDMYDAEPGWMDQQLRAASLPGIPAIEAGWSVPLTEDTGG